MLSINIDFESSIDYSYLGCKEIFGIDNKKLSSMWQFIVEKSEQV